VKHDSWNKRIPTAESNSPQNSVQVIHCGLALACATAIILWLSSELWAFVFALLGFKG